MMSQYEITLMPPSFSPWKPKEEHSRQIAVLMSGGVDSSVSAHLLKQSGWEVLGITMKIPVSCNINSRGCCGADAAFVCNELNIPHYFVDVTGPFEELIIGRFRQSYANGQTPNPCVDCNALLKFSLVWDFLQKTFGISYLATGHYARVSKTDGRVYLGRAKDKTKDQSYFLYGIASEKLAGFVFPLGELTKEKVCSIAAQLNLSVADKTESMELCFAGGGNYRQALGCAESSQFGDITDMQGGRIGTHKGIANFTLGQRRGIGFAGGKPLYVGRIDAKTNTISLGSREEISYRVIKANQINTLLPEQLVVGKQMYGKIRSYGAPRPCKLIEVNETEIVIEFDRPQFAPCPGQSVVLYDERENVVTGGIIISSERPVSSLNRGI